MNQNELIEKINKAANIIHQKNIRGEADYIIVSPEVAEIIDNLNIKRHRLKKLKQIFKNS